MPTLDLTTEERRALASLSRSRAASAADVKRARLIMMLDEGLSWSAIGERLPCTADYISRWKGRFERERMAGLYARHRGSEPAEDAAKVEARVLAWTQKPPSDGSTHWSTRKLGNALGISHMMVARIWAKHGLKPHRLERYMASDDPDFETKAADVIGLYLEGEQVLAGAKPARPVEEVRYTPFGVPICHPLADIDLDGDVDDDDAAAFEAAGDEWDLDGGGPYVPPGGVGVAGYQIRADCDRGPAAVSHLERRASVRGRAKHRYHRQSGHRGAQERRAYRGRRSRS